MMIRPSAMAASAILAVTMFGAAPAQAAHEHFLVTPNGQCHQVASGQTGISDANHGGFHRYHVNVHLGATESGTLGDGRSSVKVYKDSCP
jgi:hypothetical protein